jgi:hypothetical protein
MDRLIKENLEALLQDSSHSKRLGRRIINLAGFLSSDDPPSAIREQLNHLSRLLIQQDAFDALLEPVSLMARAGLTHLIDVHAIQSMINSLEESRKAISETEDINYAELIAWLVKQARERKIIRQKPIG